MPRFVIVGLDDPYDKTPLQPDILGSTGAKIWRMTGLNMRQYLTFFERKNLFNKDEPQYLCTGKRRAEIVMAHYSSKDMETYVICLGTVVAKAFGVDRYAKMTFVERKLNVRVAHIPHPSGLNRWYNNPKNSAAVTEFLRRVSAVAVSNEDYDLMDDYWKKLVV